MLLSGLHPSIRYLIEVRLGWKELRPAQQAAIGPILHGDSYVLVAPTSGGKTEAAALPLFSRILDEALAPVAVLYVAPLKALLNDLGERLTNLAESVGLRVAVWHGDVAETKRRRIVRDPPDLLLVTPESLEALLSFASDVRRIVLANVRSIVVDEAHVFFGSDRGTQLLALCERLSQYAAHDLQRIGLSATIGNPDDLGRWLNGSSLRTMSVGRATADAGRVENFVVRYVPEPESFVSAIGAYGHEKVLVFCPSRRDVEDVTRALALRGHDAWPHHSALATGTRAESEASFRAAHAGFLVATSTLELGIDIGDLDRVVQVDAPSTVSAMLQRLGRTGRRPGRSAEMAFVVRKPERLLLALALLRLHANGWVEPLASRTQPWLVLVQQLLALLLQTGGLARTTVLERLRTNAAFAGFNIVEIEAVVDALSETAALETVDGRLVVGPSVERRFAARNFGELSAVFASDDTVDVLAELGLVGTVQRWYIEAIRKTPGAVFLLGGTPWRITMYDATRKVVTVKRAEHAEHAAAPVFLGAEMELSPAVCRSMREMLAIRDRGTSLGRGRDRVAIDAAARDCISRLRESADSLALGLPGIVAAWIGTTPRLISYAGVRANRVLAAWCEGRGYAVASVSNTGLNLRPPIDLQQLTDHLRERLVGEAVRAMSDASVPPVSEQSKFARLLPQRLHTRVDRAGFFDLEAALAAVGEGIRVNGTGDRAT
jgi:ATP-dependent Lhr-like helicase